jgi:hypothetical protein
LAPPSGKPPGRRYTLLRKQAASPTHVEPPVDLLRPRNIYAVVLITVVVFLTVAAAGWLSHSPAHSIAAATGTPGAATPASTATPAQRSTPPASATPGPSLASPAAATPMPSAAPSPSMTSAPIPSVAQLAAAYEKAATTFNEANDAARAAWARSAQTLTDAKRLARGYAAADLAFIRAVQKIPWYGDDKALARRVLTPDNQRYVSVGSAMEATTWDAYSVSSNVADAANMQASAASNELRIALGLPPVPLLGR